MISSFTSKSDSWSLGKDLIIYTCLTNDYVDLHCDLPEGPIYVVFGYQDPPEPWIGGSIHHLESPIRSSRGPKIKNVFDQPSIYIDASKLHLINEKFLELSEEILAKNDLTFMEHPHKHTYLEECAEYVSQGWVDPDTLLQFSAEVSETSFDFEEYFSPLCTIIWRKGKTDEFNKLWWKWYEKGGVRDQLSCSVALQLSGIKYESIPSRDFINKFSNADPDGEWWDNRCGDYIFHKEETNIIEFVDLLTEITGLYDWTEYFRSGTDRILGKPFYGDAGLYSYAIDWDDPDKEQIIVYTSITNGYDTIPKDNYYDPDVKYVCFTDGTVEVPAPWEVRPIPVEIDCPRRRSAYAKINPHKLFPLGSKTVWLDGCYTHTKEWLDNSREILKDTPMTHMLHPHRFTYHNEIMEGFGANFNSKEEMLKLTHALHDVKYDFKKYCSPVLTCIWRQVSEDMFEFHDLWWKYSNIGSNRDQVSFDCAKQLTDKEWSTIHNWETIGLDLTSSTAKSGRNKRHPMAGHFDVTFTYSQIIKECYDLLAEIRVMTGIEDEHQIWKLGANEVRDPNLHTWIPEGEWWYDPTTIKSANGKYSIQDRLKIKADEEGTFRNRDTNRNNAFWVRRLKRSLGLVDLPSEAYDMHVWDWGASFRDYVYRNVLNPNLPNT